ncbi:SDR family NAD(P)-dependent oxidoreductase [Nonomuraea ceibae]|uniref:SDR family NAD(P)-dependent oxidoreductase n=1 Tax=Nonomuraea ceibae TaxID=1935170 RepID=UPI001C5F55EC|nr:SDR family oxidoreductase [Nonomuraea ceibae]
MDLGLTGKRAVVTGASRGIGLAVVRELRQEGVDVVAVSRNGSHELDETGAHAVRIDLTLAGGATLLTNRVERHLGDVDFWVNCIGGPSLHDDLLHDDLLHDDLLHALQDSRPTLDLNVITALRLAELLVPRLIARRGAMVHIAGLAAHMPGAGPLIYSAAKAALIAISKGLAARYGPYGVRSNSISPGPTATHMWEGVAAANGVSLDGLHASLPSQLGMTTGRMITAEEIASLAVYLLSTRAASITGADYVVSGGLRI